VTRLTIQHQAAARFKPNPLVDPAGRTVLGVLGDWGQVDGSGRTELFLSADLGKIAKESVISGLIGVLFGGGSDPTSFLRNTGEGTKTLKRAKPPVRGLPFRSTAVAQVSRHRATGELDRYEVEVVEAGLPAVAFDHRVTSADIQGLTNGFGDPRFGVYDLVHADGRPILRHWATIDRDLKLSASTFDVEDASVPLAFAVMLCLARYQSWRF
jgi:hypothetical protein